jgi:hypothetical protein
MKYLLVSILLINSAQAQKTQDNAVVIHNVTFDSAVKRMIEMGYHIRINDSSLKTCITEPSVSGLIIYVKVDKKGNVVVTSEYPVSFLSSGSSGMYRVAFWKHGTIHERWEEMMKFAGQFPDREYKIVN